MSTTTASRSNGTAPMSAGALNQAQFALLNELAAGADTAGTV